MITHLYVTTDSLAGLDLSQLSQPWIQLAGSLTLLLACAWLSNWIAKQIVQRLLMRLLSRLPFRIEVTHLGSIVARLSNIVPALIIQSGVAIVPFLPNWAATLAHKLCTGVIILTLAIALASTLDLANRLYQRRHRGLNRPIKGYVQVGKMLIYGASLVFIIATLLDRSPLLLLSGLGAMAAVLMLVFKDTILSLVASIQIGSNDMIRVGDWIEMPQLDADGDVIDIALHTVKVQNFDKTITTIPTHRLISESFRNWRGMQESGGRRIMRSLMLDQNSISFLSDQQRKTLSRFAPLRDYLADKDEDVARWNHAHPDAQFGGRQLTNIGTFRAYILGYLGQRADIAQDKVLLVRQLAPSENGLPLQIYAFVATTKWADYEAVQADMFDHLIAIMPHFGLNLFQRPTGSDFWAGRGVLTATG